MYVNNYIPPKPAPDVLAKCTEVLVGDPAFLMWQMRKWCREHNLSLIWSELVDVSDVSSQYDEIVAFYFIDEQDATAFTLKFK